MKLSFSQTVDLQREIERELHAIGLERDSGAIEPGSADRRAIELAHRYMKDVIGSEPTANAFAAAVGLAEPSGVGGAA